MHADLLRLDVRKRPEKLRFDGRILFLVDDADLMRRQLEGEDLDLIATDGAPVSVRVELTDDGVLAGPTDALMDFLRSVGLR